MREANTFDLSLLILLAVIWGSSFFNIKIASWSRNLEKTIKRSKAVGEPPFMLAISVHEAIQMAVASVSDYKINPRLNAPATPEEVLSSIHNIQRITQV